MSKKYAIHKFDFMYNDEWYDVNDQVDTLYEILEDEQPARQRWAALERETLNSNLEGVWSAFYGYTGNLSLQQFKAISDFIKNDCGLPLPNEEDGFFDYWDVPINDMDDEQLLQFLSLGESNHYMLREYDANESLYVIYTTRSGYVTRDTCEVFHRFIWYTTDGNDVKRQYCEQEPDYAAMYLDDNTELTLTDLQNPIVQSLLRHHQNDIYIEYNTAIVESRIHFANSPDEVVTAFNAVLEKPTYLIQKVDGHAITEIRRHPSQLRN